jgi:hypothetical protein
VELQPIVMVTKTSRNCTACKRKILEDNYCLRIVTKAGRVYIHDNDGACLELLKVQLGLAKPSFLSSIALRD